MELIILLFLLFTSTSTGSQAFDYDHMEMVLQWPPTYCGLRNVNCKGGVFRFTIHGLWPGDGRGDTHQNCANKPPPADPTVVRQVWEQDKLLKKDLDLYWPTLKSGGTNDGFWLYEWNTHGYCTQDTISPADYFRAASGFAKKKYVKGMTSMLIKKMTPSNHDSYNITEFKTLISTDVVRNKDYKVYISCQQANATYVFLHEIHFCLDKTLKTFISCPQSADTRGCGGPNKENKFIIPTTAIYN
ncbi:hypothetical protein P3S67_030392 [Capsicum chacoense]